MPDTTAPAPDERNQSSTVSDLLAAADRIIRDGGSDDQARPYIQAAIADTALRYGRQAPDDLEHDHLLDREAHGCWLTGAAYCYLCEQIRADVETVTRIEGERMWEACE